MNKQKRSQEHVRSSGDGALKTIIMQLKHVKQLNGSRCSLYSIQVNPIEANIGTIFGRHVESLSEPLSLNILSEILLVYNSRGYQQDLSFFHIYKVRGPKKYASPFDIIFMLDQLCPTPEKSIQLGLNYAKIHFLRGFTCSFCQY